MLVGVDFEFFVPLVYSFFIKGLPLIPLIAVGHLLKSVTTSIFKFYEMLFVQLGLKAGGYTPGKPAYNKLMSGSHISKTIKEHLRIASTLRINLATHYLRAHAGDTLGESTVLLLLTQQPTTLNRRIVCLDEYGRPKVVSVSPGAFQVADSFQTWCYRQAGGECSDAFFT